MRGARTVEVDVLGLDPATYRPHALHGPERVWTETNCAADLWIECLHALGEDPVAGLGFTLGTDFDGEQWRMFTYPDETLRDLYGVAVHELNVWRPLRCHVEDHLSLGHLVVFDVDAWWLPDTAGLTYRCAHQKTAVLASMIDTGARRLGYLHNAGYHVLEGDDFDAILPIAPPPDALPPFTLEVRVGMPRVPGHAAATTARRLASAHLARRPAGNPVRRMGARVVDDLGSLRAGGIDAFHRWAFGTFRQCGANAELAASFARWLAQDGRRQVWGPRRAEEAGPARCPAGRAAVLFDEIAAGMKSAQLVLARAVRGRRMEVRSIFEPLAEGWERAVALVDHALVLDGPVRGAGAAGYSAETLAAPTPALV